MPDSQQYKLLDGTFSANDAAQILLSLVKSKIDFHNLQKLSNEERFGSDTAQSAVRLEELRQLQVTLQSVCQSAAANASRLRLRGWIEIETLP